MLGCGGPGCIAVGGQGAQCQQLRRWPGPLQQATQRRAGHIQSRRLLQQEPGQPVAGCQPHFIAPAASRAGLCQHPRCSLNESRRVFRQRSLVVPRQEPHRQRGLVLLDGKLLPAIAHPRAPRRRERAVGRVLVEEVAVIADRVTGEGEEAPRHVVRPRWSRPSTPWLRRVSVGRRGWPPRGRIRNLEDIRQNDGRFPSLAD